MAAALNETDRPTSLLASRATTDYAAVGSLAVRSGRPASRPATEMSSSSSSQCKPLPPPLISTRALLRGRAQQAREPGERHPEDTAVDEIDP